MKAVTSLMLLGAWLRNNKYELSLQWAERGFFIATLTDRDGQEVTATGERVEVVILEVVESANELINITNNEKGDSK